MKHCQSGFDYGFELTSKKSGIIKSFSAYETPELKVAPPSKWLDLLIKLLSDFIVGEFTPGITSTTFNDTFEVRPFREDYYYFHQINCGKNCWWNLAKAKPTSKTERIPGNWESTNETDPSGVKIEVHDLLHEMWDRIVGVWRSRSNYCRDVSFSCIKGEYVEKPLDGANPIQKCEEFKWKTK